jgi:iron transport multicopper oxidase
MDTVMFDTVPPELQPSAFDHRSFAAPDYNTWISDLTSSITYNSSASLTNLGSVDTYHDVNDTALVPVVVEPMLPADQTIELEVTFDTMDDGTNRAMFNQITYNSPLVPTALSILTLGPNATDVTAYGTTSFILDHLSAVQLPTPWLHRYSLLHNL